MAGRPNSRLLRACSSQCGANSFRCLFNFNACFVALSSRRMDAQNMAWFQCGTLVLDGGWNQVVDVFHNNPAYGSFADFFWVTGYLPMVACLLKRFRQKVKKSSTFLMVVLATGYVAIFCLYLLPRLFDPQRLLPAKVLDVTYVSFDFLLIAMTLRIVRELSQTGDPMRYSFRLLLAATIWMTFSDLLFSAFERCVALQKVQFRR